MDGHQFKCWHGEDASTRTGGSGILPRGLGGLGGEGCGGIVFCGGTTERTKRSSVGWGLVPNVLVGKCRSPESGLRGKKFMNVGVPTW